MNSYDINLEKIDRDNKEIVFLYDCGYCKKNAPHKEIENKIRFLYICGYFEKKLFQSIGKRGACAQAR